MPTVYITSPPDAAESIATTLVETGLAACVNRFQTTSTYRWEGDLQHDEEVVLLAKTTDDAYDALVEYITDVHPHDVPCIERFDETHVLESYAAWRDDVVTTESG